MTKTSDTRPWYKRVAHWQRDRLRALRYHLKTDAGGLLSARGAGRKVLTQLYRHDTAVKAELDARKAFLTSPEFDDFVAKAVALDPNIMPPPQGRPTYMAPWHDGAFGQVKAALDALPEGPFDTVILVPFGKLGGADRVAGILADALCRQGRVVILRTDQGDWDRPDWYPEGVPSVDLSPHLTGLEEAPRALYTLIQRLNPTAIFNINSRLGFECFERFGARLKRDYRLYAYYFCADRTSFGQEVGYPVWFAADVIPHLSAALVDTDNLVQTLTDRYAVPADLAGRIHRIYTPATVPVLDMPLVDQQMDARRSEPRHKLLWAGRFDRQKRFDLVIEVARRMPDVDFHVWGKAVLEKNRVPRKKPDNLIMNPPFQAFEDLPLAECDGWLYTAEWDGLPTILIELAAMGMPIVASRVGGVPELITDETGWPVADWDEPQAYVDAIRQMLGDPEDRRARAQALLDLARSRHATQAYHNQLYAITGQSGLSADARAVQADNGRNRFK